MAKAKAKVDVKERAKELIWWISDLQNQKKSVEGLLEGARKELQEIMEQQGWDVLKDKETKKKVEIVKREIIDWDLKAIARKIGGKILEAVKPDNKKMLSIAKEVPEITKYRKITGETKYIVIKDLKEE